MNRTAVISDCGAFRYHLTRSWGPGKPMLFVMLNPSTADADVDDQTIRKCIGFAERNGCESIEVVNLFAYRATKPADLKSAGYPIGPENHATIRRVAADVVARGGMVVCAWGSNARGLGAVQVVSVLLASIKCPVYALALLADGTPAHPCMLGYGNKLVVIGGPK